MKIGLWAGLMAAAALMAGCGDFWQAPSTSTTTGFSLSSSPTSITVASGGGTGTSDITVTPGSSFTGTVTLSCAVTTQLSNPVSPTTCSLSSSSLTFSSTATQTSTLTATTTATTTPGAYDITVTGVSGTVAGTATVCVEVGTGTCTTTSSSSGNFYILNGGSSGSISGFSISSSTLATIPGGSQPVSGATAVAIAPSGEAFLYVASTTNGITLYPITSTGALSSGVNFNGDTQAEALAVDPSGKWLLDASGAGTLTAYPITSTGTLDPTRTAQPQPLASIAVEPRGITISPNGAIVAVALGSAGTQAFGFSSGTLEPGATPIKPTNTSSGTAISVATDPQSRFLYIGEIASNSTANSGGLRVFTIAGGNLTEINASNPTSSGGVAPNFILPIASGDYVYVANGEGATSSTGNITGFAVTASGISTGSTVAAGADPLGLAEDSTGDWVFEVGSSGSPYFDAYTFDTSTPGKLDSQVTSTSAATSIAIVAAPQ
ncbi:MAG: hypothetical protein ABSD44_11405 [Terracidiphilus sp.]